MLNKARSNWYELKQIIKFYKNWRNVDFSSLRTLVIFVGNPRSGTTLVRSIIDAHPNAVISNELHLLKQLEAGFSWKHAFRKICNNAAAFSKNPVWTDYSYKIPGTEKKKQLYAIGDKRSAGTIAEVSADPALINALIEWSPLPIKIIRCVRNPFDVIATRTRRNDFNLDENLDRYFYLEERAEQIADQFKAPRLHIYNEQLIGNPRGVIKELLAFLELPEDDVYIDNCESVIYTSSNNSRYDTTWMPEQLNKMESHVKSVRHLHFYLKDNSLPF